MVSGPRYDSRRASTKSGRTIAARIAPTIMHKSQLGKFAPAIVTIGSHAVKVTIDRHAASLSALGSHDNRTATACSYTKESWRGTPGSRSGSRRLILGVSPMVPGGGVVVSAR